VSVWNLKLIILLLRHPAMPRIVLEWSVTETLNYYYFLHGKHDDLWSIALPQAKIMQTRFMLCTRIYGYVYYTCVVIHIVKLSKAFVVFG